MKILLKTFIIALSVLNSQTTSQIKKAAEFVKSSGMTEAQVIEAAKMKGLSDKQIESAIKKGKDLQKSNKASSLQAIDAENSTNFDFTEDNMTINQNLDDLPLSDLEEADIKVSKKESKRLK